MTLKYLGIFFIFICCTLIGNGLAVEEKRKIERSEALRSLIFYIQREIECFRTPIGDIYNSFSDPILAKLGFVDKLRGESLKYALENTKINLCFREETSSVILNFAEFVGKSEYTDQIARCKYTLSLIDEDIKKSRDAYPKNRKMYTSLGLLSGIMIAILII